MQIFWSFLSMILANVLKTAQRFPRTNFSQIGFDFTASNGNPARPESLHHMNAQVSDNDLQSKKTICS